MNGRLFCEIMARPFLKWAGGKTQLLEEIEKRLPPCPKDGYDYVEPFLGGGALFFHLQEKGMIKTALLNDTNPELILCYRAVRDHVDELIKELKRYQADEIPNELEERKKHFFETRNEIWNKNLCIEPFRMELTDMVKRVVLTIYMNKACYNGLFRVNSKGEFNTPFGFPKNKNICDEEGLKQASEALQNVELRNDDCFELKIDSKKRNFVYFDPPYRPITETSFTAYDKSGFNDEHQKKLRDLALSCRNKGIDVLISNSDPKNYDENDDFFDDLYEDFFIERIGARRMVNSDGRKRGEIDEILVRSYDKTLESSQKRLSDFYSLKE